MNNNKINTSIDELKQQVENLILLKDQIKGFNEKEVNNLISTSKDLTKNIIDFVKKCQNNNSTEQKEFRKKTKQKKASVRNRTMKRNTRNANNYEIFSDFYKIEDDLKKINDLYKIWQGKYYYCETDRYTKESCEEELVKIEKTPEYKKFIELYEPQISEKDNIISTFKMFLRSLDRRYFSSYNGLIPQLEIIDKRLNNFR